MICKASIVNLNILNLEYFKKLLFHYFNMENHSSKVVSAINTSSY